MQSKDLRIGNFINRMFPEGKQLDIVEALSRNFINNYQISDGEPIELNNNWLIKFGFEGTKEDMFKVIPKGEAQEIHIETFFTDHFDVNITQGSDKVLIDDLSNMYISEIKYVHELQNLYFAITGEELELKHESKP